MNDQLVMVVYKIRVNKIFQTFHTCNKALCKKGLECCKYFLILLSTISRHMEL